MEYTSFASWLESKGYSQILGYGDSVPSDFVAITVNISEDDILEVCGKSLFTKQGLAFSEVIQQSSAMNQQAVRFSDSKRVFVWGIW